MDLLLLQKKNSFFFLAVSFSPCFSLSLFSFSLLSLFSLSLYVSVDIDVIWSVEMSVSGKNIYWRVWVWERKH